jgi:hypothetical protein
MPSLTASASRIAASGSSRPCWPRSSTGLNPPRARSAIPCSRACAKICNRRYAVTQIKGAANSGGPAAVRKPSVGPDQAAQGEQSTTWLQTTLHPKRTIVKSQTDHSVRASPTDPLFDCGAGNRKAPPARAGLSHSVWKTRDSGMSRRRRLTPKSTSPIIFYRVSSRHLVLRRFRTALYRE